MKKIIGIFSMLFLLAILLVLVLTLLSMSRDKTA